MTDDRVIQLLEEIRDLQRQHVENYKQALDNQRESIQMNQEWQAQTQKRLRLVVVVLILGVVLLYALPYLVRMGFSR